METGAHPPAEASALFPGFEECLRHDNALTDALFRSQGRVASGPVTPTLDPAAFRNELLGFDFEAPRSLDDLLPWVIARLEQGAVQMTHPRYFGLFNPAPTLPAQLADRIVATFNPQLATSTTSPTAVALEAHVIRAVVGRAGLPPDATGHFTTGGAEANNTALICALTAAHPEFAQHGTQCFSGPPTLYISREAHLAWIKIAHQAGIGRSAVRLVPTDGAGRMDEEALADALRRDRARGCVPVMIVATAGTTGAGMIDPLLACARTARDAAAWYHVDAAWGGALIVSDRHRGILAGLEQADSVTIDAHKWFATTMGCGLFLTRHAPTLSDAFQVSTGYMPSNVANLDPYVTSIQWSRRFLGLRLFLSLAAAGWSGYAAHVERAIALTCLLGEQLSQRGWAVVNTSPLAVLCVEPPPGSAEPTEIVRRVLCSGRAWISTAIFEGRPTVRACVTNGRTNPTDVADLVEALETAKQG